MRLHRVRVRVPDLMLWHGGGVLTETMKQFDSSVFDGTILGIISRVFDVRRHFLDGYFVSSSMFEFDLNKNTISNF